MCQEIASSIKLDAEYGRYAQVRDGKSGGGGNGYLPASARFFPPGKKHLVKQDLDCPLFHTPLDIGGANRGAFRKCGDDVE